MNSINITLQNDIEKVHNATLNLSFLRDFEDDVCLTIQYEDNQGACLQTDFYISHECRETLPKMLKLLADFIDNKS